MVVQSETGGLTEGKVEKVNNRDIEGWSSVGKCRTKRGKVAREN